MTQRAIGVTDVASGASVADYRVRERTVSSVTVGEQYLIQTPERIRSGVYRAHTGAHFLTAAAHAAGVGWWYLLNPIGSTTLVAVRFLYVTTGARSTAIVFATSPRMTLERFTFTGTHTGTLITAGQRRSTDPAPTARLSAASTGITITAGDVIRAWFPIIGWSSAGSNSASQQYGPYMRDFPSGAPMINASDPGTIDLAAGEGVLFRQADAGSTSEATSRVAVPTIAWEEYSLP